MNGGTWTVAGSDVGVRLDKFLAHADRLGSRNRAVAALDRGKIFLNDVEVGIDAAGRRLAERDTVRAWIDRPGSARQTSRPRLLGDLSILFEDEAMLVVNKPAGLLSVPLERQEDAPSVQDVLVEHLRRRKRKPYVVHRIDRDTSGLVLFATDPKAQVRLRDQFRRHDVLRIYLAIVYGTPSPDSGLWRDHLVWDRKALIQKETHPRDPQGKEAVSEYRVVERFPAASLIEVSLITGKRNQIRLQARLRGHTLVGERRYTFGPDELRTIDFARQALHAHRLGFHHPVSDAPMEFEAPIPPDMAELLDALRDPRRPRKGLSK